MKEKNKYLLFLASYILEHVVESIFYLLRYTTKRNRHVLAPFISIRSLTLKKHFQRKHNFTICKSDWSGAHAQTHIDAWEAGDTWWSWYTDKVRNWEMAKYWQKQPKYSTVSYYWPKEPVRMLHVNAVGLDFWVKEDGLASAFSLENKE